MIWNWFYFGVLHVSVLLISLSLGQPNELHRIQKRQIGVLARTGTLPQGKRSLETSAHNREPFVDNNGMENSHDTLESLIQGIKAIKRFIILKSLEEKLFERQNSIELLKYFTKTSSCNEQLQEKNLTEDKTMLCQFISFAQNFPNSFFDLINSYNLLAKIKPSIVFEHSDKSDIQAAKYFYPEDAKKKVDLKKIFFIPEYNDKNLFQYPKKNLASLAKNDGFFSLKYPLLKEHNWRNNYDFVNLNEYDGRNKHEGKRQESEEEGTLKTESFEQRKSLCGKKKTKKTDFRKVDELKKKLNPYFERLPGYSVLFGNDSLNLGYSLGRLKSKENLFKKRFLGRIPQLGRTHQKVQSPSSRRRPHLRPNWL